MEGSWASQSPANWLREKARVRFYLNDTIAWERKQAVVIPRWDSSLIILPHISKITNMTDRASCRGNEQVIHAGIYYPAESLKTRLCINGKNQLYKYCAEKGVPHRITKKWIVAQNEIEWDACLNLHEHAKRIGVPTRFVNKEEARRLEPDVRAEVGIVESPTTGILDVHSFMACLQGDFEDRGGDVAFKTAVTRIEPIENGKGGYRIYASSSSSQSEDFDRENEIEDESSSITAETIINSAGLYACQISNMILPPERHRTPFYAKGTYFSYGASKPKPSTLIYPAPVPGHGGLGTHLTLDLGNRIRFGPDVEWTTDPTDYKPSPARLQQALPEIRRYLPSINLDAIVLDYCGIRPKLGHGSANTAGKGFQDFVIQKEEGYEGFVNLLGIESPGLTSSMAIANMVDELLYQ